jgi:hypothetical protein
MQIKLCSQEIFDELHRIADEHPELIFQNNGYESLSRKVQEVKAAQIARVSTILREHVTGFSKFFNYKHNTVHGLTLRFYYNWGEEDKTLYFIGVGYLPLKALREGFKACGMESQC